MSQQLQQPRKPRKQEIKTYICKKGENEQNWLIFDASGKTLGRLASEIAKVLRGKHKPIFTPFIDTGDGVIVINAEKIKVTGAKEAQKIYYRHTGYQSGLRKVPYRTMMDRKPTYILEHAVKGMMPKTKMGRSQFKKLKVFAGSEHKMQAQKPTNVNI